MCFEQGLCRSEKSALSHTRTAQRVEPDTEVFGVIAKPICLRTRASARPGLPEASNCRNRGESHTAVKGESVTFVPLIRSDTH